MTVGLVGVILSIILGSILGTVSGYYMGVADDVIQRIIEVDQLISHHSSVGRSGSRFTTSFRKFYCP